MKIYNPYQLLSWKLKFIIVLIIASSYNFKALSAVSIIPQPVSVKEKEGEFILNNKTIIIAEGEHQLRSANFFIDYLKKYYGISLKTSTAKAKKSAPNNSISFNLLKENKESAIKAGSYNIAVNSKNISLNGYENSPEGLFYATQSLIQMLPIPENLLAPQHSETNHSFRTISSRLSLKEDSLEAPSMLFMKNPVKQLAIQCVEVYDVPAFEYRGQHLDVARHIYPVEYIKKYIDYIAYHKMNYFHWHLTDDQAWRIEMKSHPKLNEIGSWRDGTIIGVFPGTGVDSTRYGGYYTQMEIKDIVRYASDRYITIVPEIDIPAHSMATLACYPEFSTTPDKEFKPAITWGLYNRQNNVLAPSEKLFEFLSDVFNELIDLFPSKYIHFGGDEACQKWWKESPATQEFIKQHNLGNEDGLQRYFVEYVNNVITKRGRIGVAWDDVVTEDKIPDNLLVMNWRNKGNDKVAVKQGHKVIQTPISYCYFNCKQFKDEKQNVHHTRFVPLEKTYSYKLIPDSLTSEQAALIMGGQGCLWTEYYQNIQKVEYGIFPRMTAMAEVMWSPEDMKNFDNFTNRLSEMYRRYQLWGANYFMP